MAVVAPLLASFGSFAVRVLGESEIDENTTKYLAKEINLEEATRIVSENIKYYASIVAIKAVCDIVVASVIGRNLYHMFKKLFAILKPLLKSGLKGFFDGIMKCAKCIQDSLKELHEKGVLFHTIWDKVRPKITFTNVLKALNCIFHFFESTQAGLCYRIKFELTKYYLETIGFIRAICEKNNIDFSKYMLKAGMNSNSSSSEDNTETGEKDEPLTYAYEISLEQLLYGTERQIRISREIREIKQPIRTECQTYTITIEPGCKEGHIIRLSEVGDRDPMNIPADLLITIRSKPHPLFKREGADLIYIKTMTYADSRNGYRTQVPLLSGGTTFVDPKGPVDINTQLIVPGHGLPNPDQKDERGQLLIRFDIQTPPNKILRDNCIIKASVEGISIDEID